MPVRSESSTSVIWRWARTCRKRPPTCSRAAEMASLTSGDLLTRSIGAAFPRFGNMRCRGRGPARMLTDMSNYDVVVVGGGAAGLSAGLVLSRARRRVLVLDAGHPRNAPAAHMHGFLSRDGMPPAELLAHGRDEVRSYGGRVVTGAVEGITACHRGGFRVMSSHGQQVTARQVLLATGLRDALPA